MNYFRDYMQYRTYKYDEDSQIAINNEAIRTLFNSIIENEGIKITHIAKKLEFDYSLMISWRKGYHDYEQNELELIKAYCDRFNSEDGIKPLQ